jgi:hypothetical protein
LCRVHGYGIGRRPENQRRFAPEDWAEPQAFYKALGRVGVPHDELAHWIDDGSVDSRLQVTERERKSIEEIVSGAAICG